MGPYGGNKEEPITRRENISKSKQQAEGGPSEIAIVLGWMIDTWNLLIRLPSDKFIAWIRKINTFLNPEKEGFKIRAATMDTLIGHLNHATYVILLARHFLNNLRRKKDSVEKYHKNQTLRLSKDEKLDLELWLSFLRNTRKVISLNFLTQRNPTQVGISDSSVFGLGGFSWGSGCAWRLRIPKSSPLRGDCTANNVLEFLTMAITTWIIIKDCKRLNLV